MTLKGPVRPDLAFSCSSALYVCLGQKELLVLFCFCFILFFLSFSRFFLLSFFKQKHVDTHLSMTSLKKGQSDWAGCHLCVSLWCINGPHPSSGPRTLLTALLLRDLPAFQLPLVCWIFIMAFPLQWKKW